MSGQAVSEKTIEGQAVGLYDRDRAADAGGFTDDLAYGRSVARLLYATAVAAVQTGATPDAGSIIDATIDAVATELHDTDPRGNTFWLAAMHNAVTDMYRDLVAQFDDHRQ